MYCIYTFGDIGSVPCREVVPFSEGPLLEVSLYYKFEVIYSFILGLRWKIGEINTTLGDVYQTERQTFTMDGRVTTNI